MNKLTRSMEVPVVNEVYVEVLFCRNLDIGKKE